MYLHFLPMWLFTICGISAEKNFYRLIFQKVSPFDVSSFSVKDTSPAPGLRAWQKGEGDRKRGRRTEENGGGRDERKLTSLLAVIRGWTFGLALIIQILLRNERWSERRSHGTIGRMWFMKCRYMTDASVRQHEDKLHYHVKPLNIRMITVGKQRHCRRGYMLLPWGCAPALRQVHHSPKMNFSGKTVFFFPAVCKAFL